MSWRFASLRLGAITINGETDVLGTLEQTVLLWRIHKHKKFHGCQHCIGLGIEVHIYISESLSEGTWYKDHMSTSYHPLTYCQLERTIENLNDMSRDCVGWNFGKHLPLPEFAYIDNYLSMGERHELKVLMVQKTAEQMEMLNDGLSESHDVKKFMQLSAINIWSYIWAT
ncbi:hypothetical protein YC2023_098633 [Brassica napus]